MSRVILAAVIAVMIGVLSGSSALAANAQLVRTDISIPVGTQLPFNGICSFPVQGTVLQDKEVQTVYSDGRQTITGALKVQFQNSSNGKTVSSNVSGPAFFTPNPDGSFTASFGGRSLIFPNGTNLLFISSGRTIMSVNSSMTFFTLVSVTGSTFDLCTALA